MTDTNNPLLKALRELGGPSSLLAREARAKSYLRLLAPKTLRYVLENSRTLQGLVEEVVLEQLVAWSEEEIEEMRGQAARRKAQHMAKEDQ